MIIVNIIGGLGNQMFQYAYAKALDKKGYQVKIDISAFENYSLHGGYQLDKYNIELEIASKSEVEQFYKRNSVVIKIKSRLKLLNNRVIKDNNLLFDNTLLQPPDNRYIIGYFQSEKYFIELRNELIKQFQMIDSISLYTKKLSDYILSCKKSCSLHIRRGDYVTNPQANKVHGVCGMEYYRDAINVIENEYPNIKFFIFSDDIIWVREKLKINNAVYIDSKEKRIPHEDIYLMSLCQHNIIANSSFSWWGAWLNKNNSKIIIAPSKWFLSKEIKDIIPENWRII